MDKVKLVAKGIELKLVVESDWQCHVYYSDGKHYKEHYLGINSVDYVCSYLISGISKESMADEVLFQHEHFAVFWIMSLFTAHVCLYGNISDEGFKLFCQEDGGHYLPTITLDQKNIKKWIAQLSKLRLKYQSER